MFPGMLTAAWGQIVKPTYRQSFFNPYLYNPALVGIRGEAELNLIYKKQAVGFDGAPVTTGVNLQFPTSENRVVLGFSAIVDKQSLMRNTSILGTFGYIVPIDKKQSLRFGLSAGIGINSFDLTAEELNTNDPAFLAVANNNRYMDGSFGVAYTSSGLKLGLVLTELFNTNPFEAETFSKFHITNLKNRLYSVSYRFNLDRFENFALEPYFMFRESADGLQNSWEAASVLHYKTLLWTGASYHETRGIGLFFGMEVLEKLRFSYNYEFPPIKAQLGGLSSHELQMSLRLSKKK